MPSSYPLITDSVAQAAKWLKEGQLLAYPTESVWGIGCDAYDEEAVLRILDIKQRSQAKGMIVVTDSVARIKPLFDTLNTKQCQSIQDSWFVAPNKSAKQAHTWILPLSAELRTPIPTWITGSHDSVAVRVIAHPLIQQLCAQVVSASNPYGFIISTSCNPSGQSPAATFTEAYGYFGQSIAYLEGETLGYNAPSQIHDASTGLVIR